MSVSVISSEEALRRTGSSLAVSAEDCRTVLSSALLGQSLRRTALSMAPCTRGELERAVFECLAPLSSDAQKLKDALHATTEDLLVFGDLLEMRAREPEARTFVIRPAPPHYVEVSRERIFVLGVGTDAMTPLPGALAGQIRYHGSLRILKARPGQDLVADMSSVGLSQLPQAAWLRTPKLVSAQSYVTEWQAKLSAEKPAGDVEGLLVISHDANVRYYQRRWSPPTGKSGVFIARRPQTYGAELWCIAELERGRVLRVHDIASVGDRVRPCDIAWRIQMAFDAVSGKPQVFRIKVEDGKWAVEFQSPLPSWAERRLFVSGTRLKRPGSLVTFIIDPDEWSRVQCFLSEHLWLQETRN